MDELLVRERVVERLERVALEPLLAALALVPLAPVALKPLRLGSPSLRLAPLLLPARALAPDERLARLERVRELGARTLARQKLRLQRVQRRLVLDRLARVRRAQRLELGRRVVHLWSSSNDHGGARDTASCAPWYALW